MSQQNGKFIQNDTVSDLKVRLRNNQPLRGRNAADSGDINIIKVNSSNVPEFTVQPVVPGSPSSTNEVANKGYVDSQIGAISIPTSKKQSFTLTGTDITNQYVDLLNVAKTDSIDFFVVGAGPCYEGLDYTVSYTGGAGGKTRITFAGDFATAGATPLAAADVLKIYYTY